ncbi:malto-oligosyltrehalose trehalohydrolase [Paenarthrobacter sp. PH39-S1]|uniref:malto-oligosyltrehalose trehalohydrolase n=1 Tax=Paenarthrobacter sp. PH39-S1 TaxID=3046204 RepID=UPI0024BA4B28|nr:malto-oligosyltrehalose trehalohydrolase [Paenarthrobacter sp. PH39-S1]MDJ0355843.1 malto-oligosyltrehalose trehalohydrolase [Paenarthrobacter sp. PH39-S1]
MIDRDTASTRFDLWAPDAESVTLLAEGQRLPMTRSADGWWAAAGAPRGADVDYGYLLNGEDTPLPDPRSRRQPGGVHELSRTFDAGGYLWGDGAWTGRPLAGGVIYELHIGTFTPEGTLDAAIAKLDYLVDLGVDFVELLPVNAFNGTHNWGYDGVLWYAVHEVYGGPEAYQRFVDACHRRGLGVIQDVVYNHLGPSGNYLPRFGPYLAQGSSNTWGDTVNLDGPGSDEVRRYIVENMLMWFRDYHVDGLRLDAVHALQDSRAVHILEELAVRADAASVALSRPLSLIAESDLNDPRLVYPRAAHGDGLTGQWSDDFHHAVHVNITGETDGYYADFASVGALAKVLTNGFFHDGTYSSFRGRHHGRVVDPRAAAPWQLVVCIQNHDQIGNRAIGDRLGAAVGFDLLAVAAVLNLASPFTPMLFMGEEYGAGTPWQFFTSHPEAELGKATAEGRIREFERMGWDPAAVPDPQDPQTFARSKLDWDEAAGGAHAYLLEQYRQLIALRRSTPALTDPTPGATRVDFSEADRWLLMHRGSGPEAVGVAVNLADEPCAIPNSAGVAQILFSTRDGAVLSAGQLELPGRSAVVFRRVGGMMKA